MQQFVQQSLMISSLVQLTLAAVCGLRQRHRRLSRLYSYYSLGLFGISFAPLLYAGTGHKLWLTMLALSLAWTGLLFYHFVSAIVSELSRQRLLALRVATVVLVVLAVLALREMLTGLLLWTSVTLLGVVPFIYGIERSLARVRSSFSRLEKRQLSYLVASNGVLALAGVADLVTSLEGGETVLRFGSVGLLGLALGTTVSLARYKFLDLPAQLGRGIGILVSAYLLWSIYSALMTLFESSFGDIVEPRAVSIVQLAMATGVILLLFDPLRRIVIEQMDRVLTRESYTFQRELTNLSSSLVSVLELSELFAKVLEALTSSPRVAHAEILLSRAETQDFRTFSASVPAGGAHRLDRGSALVLLLEQEHRVLVLDEMERSVQLFYPSEQQKLVDAAAQQLREFGGELIVPLWFQKKLSGLVVLRSAKESGPFTTRERELLLSLAGQLAITVENARIYEQMRQHDRLVAVGEMATGLAHEIRNPLGSIKAAAQYIEPGMVGNEDREFLSILIEEVDRLNNVVSRFLDYARPLQTRLSTHNLNQIVQRVVTLMAPEAASRQVELRTQLDPELPEMYIDGEQLRQVLLNLLLNAIEAFDEKGGTVCVSTRFVSTDAEPPAALVRIEDSGRGIQEEELDKIFHPFYTTKGSGTGLGLAIAYRILQAHEGTIRVQSEVGLGTTFEFQIPVKADPESAAVAVQAGAA